MTAREEKIIKCICIAILILLVLYISSKGQEKENIDTPEYWKESREADKQEEYFDNL